MIFLSDKHWEIKETKNKGRGLFAKKTIKPGIVIGDYIGTVLKTAEVNIEEDKQNLFLMYYHDQASIYPNLQKPGIYLLNHSCTPNSWLDTYKGHILAFTLRQIFPGEELTISYLLSPKDEFCSPCIHICKCQSFLCKKTMHLSQQKYKKWRAYQDAKVEKDLSRGKADMRQRIYYGKELPPLSLYPKIISDNPIYDLFGYTKNAISFGDKILPKTAKIRKLIRKTGRVIDFPALNKRIYGVQDNFIVSEKLSK